MVLHVSVADQLIIYMRTTSFRLLTIKILQLMWLTAKPFVTFAIALNMADGLAQSHERIYSK